jgi:hypothetical protein
VEQAETPLLAGHGEGGFLHPEGDPRAAFLESFRDVGKLLHSSDLSYSKMDLVPPEPTDGVIVWGMWITRIPYY